METKLHTSLATLKVLMLKTCAVIIKKKKPHVMWDLLYAYHLRTKGKHKVGYCYKTKSAKMNKIKQLSF
jgi:hypothetical protein